MSEQSGSNQSTSGRGAGHNGGDPEAPLSDIIEILSTARTERGADTRFVLNFQAPPHDDGAIAAQIEASLRLPVAVGPLFEPDPDLDRFRLLKLPGVGRLERSDLFDVARALRTITGADTVDPDLGTDYYDADPPMPPPGSAEGADFMFWCWASDRDKPADPDWALTLTRTPQAWAYSAEKGKPAKGDGALVFQPDTGVVPTHVELPRNAENSAGAANLIETGRPPIDPMQRGLNPGHGTGTGSVLASPEDGRMRGAAPRATLVPIRCVESVAIFDQSPVAQAIDHARRQGAHVISMSLGGVLSAALHAAVSKAVAANVIVIAAAGNCVGEVVWPARYDETIAVGGINARSVPWKGSSHGPAVAISGPAEFVLRADPRDPAEPDQAVGGGQGTSFATAHLAGVAALWLAHHGRTDLVATLPRGTSLQAMFLALARRSARTPAGFDTEEYGAGIVDALALLELSPGLAGEEAATMPASPDPRRQVAELVARTFGTTGAEAAAPALADPQNSAEVACLALDRLRAGRTRREQTEAMPPAAMSVGLRRILGADAALLARTGRPR